MLKKNQELIPESALPRSPLHVGCFILGNKSWQLWGSGMTSHPKQAESPLPSRCRDWRWNLPLQKIFLHSSTCTVLQAPCRTFLRHTSHGMLWLPCTYLYLPPRSTQMSATTGSKKSLCDEGNSLAEVFPWYKMVWDFSWLSLNKLAYIWTLNIKLDIHTYKLHPHTYLYTYRHTFSWKSGYWPQFKAANRILAHFVSAEIPVTLLELLWNYLPKCEGKNPRW